MTQGKTLPPIDASPTKASFVAVLIRDVVASMAISELVDNCVDGAKRMRPDGNFSGLYVDVRFDDKSFVIEDNCGGIPVEVAKDYAFRFGRPKKLPKALRTNLPVGQFGVGMKRALFKMGQSFIIESIAPNSSFVVKVDVDKWKAKTDVDEHGHEIWEFEFTEYHPNQRNAIAKCGTKITIAPLYKSVGEDLKLINFQNRLIESIRSEHAVQLQKKLKITINEFELQGVSLTLLKSKKIKPFHKAIDIPQKVTDENGKEVTKHVKVKLYAGISDINYLESGWYVICNGRLVLKADRSKATGWGEEIFIDPDDEKGKVKIPKGHPQYSRFRGYAYFESNDASLLPWNTTKSGVDLDSPVYQAAKLEMIIVTRQIVDFLNALDREIDNDEEFLTEQIRAAAAAGLGHLRSSATFSYQKATAVAPRTVKIKYKKRAEDVERVMSLLGASSADDAGSTTFDLFLETESGNG